MTFVTAGLVQEGVKAGLLRMLAVGGGTRLPDLPDVPTVAESGLDGFDGTSWFGLFAPAGTPAEIVTKVNADVRRIFRDPEFQRKFLTPNMLEAKVSLPDEFAAAIHAGVEKWGKIIRSANLKAN
jgi:tripartite-type tricarboxylate transporter receptor subunit TctC